MKADLYTAQARTAGDGGLAHRTAAGFVVLTSADGDEMISLIDAKQNDADLIDQVVARADSGPDAFAMLFTAGGELYLIASGSATAVVSTDTGQFSISASNDQVLVYPVNAGMGETTAAITLHVDGAPEGGASTDLREGTVPADSIQVAVGMAAVMRLTADMPKYQAPTDTAGAAAADDVDDAPAAASAPAAPAGSDDMPEAHVLHGGAADIQEPDVEPVAILPPLDDEPLPGDPSASDPGMDEPPAIPEPPMPVPSEAKESQEPIAAIPEPPVPAPKEVAEPPPPAPIPDPPVPVPAAISEPPTPAAIPDPPTPAAIPDPPTPAAIPDPPTPAPATALIPEATTPPEAEPVAASAPAPAPPQETPASAPVPPEPAPKPVGVPASSVAPAMVLGIACSQHHHNHPDAVYCSQCGTKMGVHHTTVLINGPRPPLGVLVVDDGTTYSLSQDLVIGREPTTHDDVVAGTASPMILTDDTLSLSRKHARIVLDEWAVMVQDLGSSNGTYLSRAGNAENWDRLAPSSTNPLEPGDRLRVGGRIIQVELHHVR